MNMIRLLLLLQVNRPEIQQNLMKRRKAQQKFKKFRHQKIGAPAAPCETKHVHFGDIVDVDIEKVDKKSSKSTEIKFPTDPSIDKQERNHFYSEIIALVKAQAMHLYGELDEETNYGKQPSQYQYCYWRNDGTVDLYMPITEDVYTGVDDTEGYNEDPIETSFVTHVEANRILRSPNFIHFADENRDIPIWAQQNTVIFLKQNCPVGKFSKFQRTRKTNGENGKDMDAPISMPFAKDEYETTPENSCLLYTSDAADE